MNDYQVESLLTLMKELIASQKAMTEAINNLVESNHHVICALYPEETQEQESGYLSQPVREFLK